MARRAVERHVECWNNMDRARWVSLFSPTVVFEDPVGAPPKHGLDAVHNSWDRSFRPGRRWYLRPQHVVEAGAEAAVVMHNEGHLGEKIVQVRGIEIFTVDAAGLIVSVRSFFDQPTEFALDEYFTAR
ncbi:MAG: nuclear transport factor 2 family protein [Acidimicrobiia bacterium]